MSEPKLFREEWSDSLAEEALDAFEVLQEDILLIIASRLEIISTLSPEELASMATAAAIAKYLNEDMAKIRDAIKKQNRKYALQVTRIFREVEEENYKFAKKYFDYRKIPINRIRESEQMRELIEAMQKQTVSGLLNLSHTYCYDYDGNVTNIGKAYRKIVNKAVIGMSTGATSYQKEMRKAINQLTSSGIKTLEWDTQTGKATVRRADSHIRMNILEGVRRLNAAIQEENGKAFGADGVETSMHYLCAEDHQPYQGRQYSKEQWESINNSLQRPFGTLNCQHFVSTIILGVSVPVYSEEERQNAISESNRIVQSGDRKMTRYEASQELRHMERIIRMYRSRKKAFQAAGDTDSVQKTDRKIKERVKYYNRFCADTGLALSLDRTKHYI